MSWIRERARDALARTRRDFRALTGAVFWVTLGSLITLYTVAPEATLTKQVLPLEIGLLIGMSLGYLSFGREPQ